jgi:very-short-patch-repair endonuclease
LVSIIACEGPALPRAQDECVSKWARAAEWLSSQTSAPVILGFPRSWTPIEDTRLSTRWTPSGTVSVVDWSVGQPHHFSNSEHRLATAIGEDAELRALFAFNRTLRTNSGTTAKVDLLWLEGRLAIEVDGFELHGTETAFRSDRQRDFELIAAGYTVLRLTDDEIFQDVARVLEKIRTLVRLRRKV